MAHCAGGGDSHFRGVRDAGWVNIEIRVAVHAIARTMGEGRALEKTGWRGVAYAAAPIVGIRNWVASMAGCGALWSSDNLAVMIIRLGVDKEVACDLSMAVFAVAFAMERRTAD